MKEHHNIRHTWGEGLSKFQTTEWTQVERSQASRAITGELYQRYQRPVYLYLCRRGFSKHQAQDLIQSFFTDKVLGQQLFDKADPGKGKFRTFLLSAIRNYAIDQHRTAKSENNWNDSIQPATLQDNPVNAFNRTWALQVLEDCLQELEAECQTRGKKKHWDCFRYWLLEPQTLADKTTMSDICRKLHIDDPSQAYNMIANIKRRFQLILRKRLRRQVRSDDQVDEEITDFLKLFSRDTERM
ncbi:RNA polymerase sigma factor [Planctomycetota bacterium]